MSIVDTWDDEAGTSGAALPEFVPDTDIESVSVLRWNTVTDRGLLVLREQSAAAYRALRDGGDAREGPLLDTLSSDLDALRSRMLCAARTEDGKHVVQQLAQRSCTAAAAAMLILDAGRSPDVSALITTNLGDDATICAALRRAGLEPVCQTLDHQDRPTSLAQLQANLARLGPATVAVYDAVLGGHQIILDAVDRRGAVTLRDPYHGWQITTQPQCHYLQRWGLLDAGAVYIHVDPRTSGAA